MEYVYVVIVTYLNTVERVFVYDSEDKANKKAFLLNCEWVNKDDFLRYLEEDNIDTISLETYRDFYLRKESDIFVDIKKSVLDLKETK